MASIFKSYNTNLTKKIWLIKKMCVPLHSKITDGEISSVG